MPEATAPDLQLARFLRHDTLRRLGRRLVADYAPESARQLFDAAAAEMQSDGLRDDLARAEAVLRSGLALVTNPAGSLQIGREDGRVIARIESNGEVPEGLALVALAHGPGLPISITPTGTQEIIDALSSTEMAPVGNSGTAAEPSFVLRQTGFLPGGNTFDLVPTAFYRGRIVEARDPLRVLISNDDKVQVTLSNPDHKGFGDQFLDHPDRGYLHYGTTLSFRIVLANTTNQSQKAHVRAWLDGAEDRALTGVVDLGPGQVDNRLQWSVTATDRPPAWNEVPLDRPRFLTVEVLEGGPGGRPLAFPRRFEFHQLDVKQYAEVTPSNAITNRLQVVVHHKRTDPVRGPFRVKGIVGTELLEKDLNGGDVWVARGGKPAILQSQLILPGTQEKIPYSISIGLKENAFRGEVSTNAPAPAAQPPQTPPPATGAPNL